MEHYTNVCHIVTSLAKDPVILLEGLKVGIVVPYPQTTLSVTIKQR